MIRPRRRTIVWGVLAAAAVLVVGRVLAEVDVDHAWYAAMGALPLWRARVANNVLLTGGIAAANTLFLFANLYAVRRSIVSVVFPHRLGNIEIGQAMSGRYLTIATLVVALVLGLALALPLEPWTELASARYGLPFRESDPYFQLDLGFFVYWLPLERALYVRMLILLLVTMCLVVFLYFALTPSLRWNRRRIMISPRIRRHIAVLGACLFVALAWSYRLDAYGLLSQGSGPAGAFTALDHHFGIPANRVLAVLTMAAGIVMAAVLWRGQVRSALGLVTAAIVLPLIVFHAVPPLLSHSEGRATAPSPREYPYTVIRAQSTREAYGLSALDLSQTAPRGFASRSDAANGVSIWDPKALTETMLSSPRQHVIPGSVAWQSLPTGLAVVAIDRSDRGQPAFLIPMRADDADERGASIRSPSASERPIPPVLVYDGAEGYAVIADSLGKIAAPPIDGWFGRVAHAWSAQNLGLINIDLPSPDPKILETRDVRDRVDALVPFFTQGSVVWPIIAGDSLFWAIDLYVSADEYPFSEHLEVDGNTRSYFQHAAIAFVHAYTGHVTLVADRTLDPIARTWVRQFPTLFTAASSLPPALIEGAPPRIDAAMALATTFASVGTRAGVGSHAIVSDGADSTVAGDELPCIAASAASAACEWAIPVVDATQRVTGLIVAEGGAEGNMERTVQWWPLAAAGVRWLPTLNLLTHAADSALGAQHESPGVRGRLRICLINGQLVLIQPLYEWHIGTPPALVRVAVVANDSAWSAPTLMDAFAVPGMPSSAYAGQPKNFRTSVEALYDSMHTALEHHDLGAFGAAYKALGQLLGRAP